MARRRESRPNPQAINRTARVGELIRRIVAEELDDLGDERLELVSITAVDVDRELGRAVVWFTTLDDDDDPEVEVAFATHAAKLRRAVGDQARLRKVPRLEFRPDASIRSAERIEELLRDDTPSDDGPGPEDVDRADDG